MKDSQEEMVRKRRYLTPEEKYQIFLEVTMAKARGNGSIREILRRWGIRSSDLTRIRAAVKQEQSALLKNQRVESPKST